MLKAKAINGIRKTSVKHSSSRNPLFTQYEYVNILFALATIKLIMNTKEMPIDASDKISGLLIVFFLPISYILS